MTEMEIIVTKMALCLLGALLIGLFFGYLYTKRKTKEMYEDKIDALEELCEANKTESKELKNKYGSMEIDMLRLKDINKEYEETLEKNKKSIEEYESKLEECGKSEEKVAALEELYESKKREVEELKKQYEKSDSEIEKLKETCNTYEKRISECEKQAEKDALVIEGYQNREAEIEAIEKEYESKKAEIEKLKSEYADVDTEISKLQAECKEYEEKIETYKDSILYYQTSVEECKKREEEMLAQIEILVKKNDTLEQKMQTTPDETVHEAIDTHAVMDKLSEINELMREKGELVPQHIKDEIIQEVEAFKEEMTDDIKGSKITTFVQNIFKKLKK